MYGKGIDDAVSQMKCVVNSSNTYTPLQDVENIKVIAQTISSNETRIEIKAILFSENDAHFTFICDNALDDFDVKPKDAFYFSSTGEIRDIKGKCL